MKKIHDHPEQYRYDLNNAASSSDCTGLIAIPPQTEEEFEAYNAIYHYDPSNIKFPHS